MHAYTSVMLVMCNLDINECSTDNGRCSYIQLSGLVEAITAWSGKRQLASYVANNVKRTTAKFHSTSDYRGLVSSNQHNCTDTVG